MDIKASISAVKQVSAKANLVPGSGRTSAMVEHRLTYDGTAIKLGDVTQTFSQVKSACDDATKFVFLVYENRLYIPQYMYNDRIYFTCTYPTETSGVMTRRIAMMSNGTITVNNTELQTAISDLETIRSGAALGATALQSESDPTVPGWAKQTTKPSYTKSEVGLGNVDNVKQYSTSNPPPYPVTSVNGKTGAVNLGAADVGAATEDYVDDEINDVQSQIDAIISRSDVVDVVGTYAELQAYDTSSLGENDVVKVLDDSTHNNQRSYYRWSNNTWVYIGSESVGYTKAETDALLNGKQGKIAASGILKGDGSGGVSAAVAGTDYQAPINFKTDPEGAIYKIDNQELAARYDYNGNEIATTYATKTELSGKLSTTGNGSNVTAAFTQASTRANLSTGEKLSVLFGKIAKWYADLKTVAFTGSYNDLTNKPTIPTVPTNVSAFNNDAGYLTSHQSLAAYRTASAQDTIDNNQNAVISGKQNKPALVTSGTNITLTDNTEYRLSNVTSLAIAYPSGNFDCWLKITTASSGTISITLPSSRYIGDVPTFANGETWELSIKDGVVVAGKAVSA